MGGQWIVASVDSSSLQLVDAPGSSGHEAIFVLYVKNMQWTVGYIIAVKNNLVRSIFMSIVL